VHHRRKRQRGRTVANRVIRDAARGDIVLGRGCTRLETEEVKRRPATSLSFSLSVALADEPSGTYEGRYGGLALLAVFLNLDR
jgi:hypothetical protein